MVYDRIIHGNIWDIYHRKYGMINDHLLVGGGWNHGIFLGNLWLIYG